MPIKIFSRAPWASLIIVCGISIISCSCFRFQATATTPGPDQDTLLRVAQDYGKNVPLPSTTPTNATAKPTDSDEAGVMEDIHLALLDGNYDKLETAFGDARKNKTRMVGGAWKLSEFYSGVEFPRVPADITDPDYQTLIAALKSWESAKPQSATARIALAGAYVNYAWFARGNGESNSVTTKGWYLFERRIATASSFLVEAAKLPEKCPHWYQVMEEIAKAQGWGKVKANALFEQAYAFEPLFYMNGYVHAEYLEPKWAGEPGDFDAFVQEISDRIGGKQGDFYYFEMATAVGCGCDSEKAQLASMSWPRVKNGYEAMDELYGISNYKLNVFAVMALQLNDFSTARSAIAQIGDNWSKDAWHTEARFNQARAWAQGVPLLASQQ
jgi:hypothetical protein